MELSAGALDAWGWAACSSYIMYLTSTSTASPVTGVDTDSFALQCGPFKSQYQADWLAPEAYTGMTVAILMTLDSDATGALNTMVVSVLSASSGDLHRLSMFSTGIKVVCRALVLSGSSYTLDVGPQLAPGAAAPAVYACTLTNGQLITYLDGVMQASSSIGGATFGSSASYRLSYGPASAVNGVMDVHSIYMMASSLNPVSLKQLTLTMTSDAGIADSTPAAACPAVGAQCSMLAAYLISKALERGPEAHVAVEHDRKCGSASSSHAVPPRAAHLMCVGPASSGLR